MAHRTSPGAADRRHLVLVENDTAPASSGRGSGTRAPPTIDRAGVRWSMAGFVVVGIAGLLLNLVIGNRYGSTVLGRFNVLLAMFIIGGQVGSIGIQSSVLFHTPRAEVPGPAHGQVLVAALKVNAVSSGVCVAVVVGGGELCCVPLATMPPGPGCTRSRSGCSCSRSTRSCWPI